MGDQEDGLPLQVPQSSTGALEANEASDGEERRLIQPGNETCGSDRLEGGPVGGGVSGARASGRARMRPLPLLDFLFDGDKAADIPTKKKRAYTRRMVNDVDSPAPVNGPSLRNGKGLLGKIAQLARAVSDK
jgi:hypothetical protein